MGAGVKGRTIREKAKFYELKHERAEDARDNAEDLVWAYEGMFNDARAKALDLHDRLEARRETHKQLQREVWKLLFLAMLFEVLAWFTKEPKDAPAEEAEAA